jgi:hypothetical protein
MLRSARLLAPSFALFLGCLGFGLCASSYGKEISFASSAREAAPFAAPFFLFAASAGFSFALSAASAMDAAEKLSRSPRSRSRLS